MPVPEQPEKKETRQAFVRETRPSPTLVETPRHPELIDEIHDDERI
jgi:hypothetical protein